MLSMPSSRYYHHLHRTGLSLSLSHYLNNGNLFRVWAAISTSSQFTITTATHLVVVVVAAVVIIIAAAAAVDHHPVIFRRFNDTRMCLSIGLTLTITLVDLCRCRCSSSLYFIRIICTICICIVSVYLSDRVAKKHVPPHTHTSFYIATHTIEGSPQSIWGSICSIIFILILCKSWIFFTHSISYVISHHISLCTILKYKAFYC